MPAIRLNPVVKSFAWLCGTQIIALFLCSALLYFLSSTILFFGRIVLIILILFLFMFPAGYCILQISGVAGHLGNSDLTRLIWYLVTGWAFHSVFWFLMGFLAITPLIIFTTYVISTVVASWFLAKRVIRMEKNGWSWRSTINQFTKPETRFLLVLFVFSFCYFCWRISQMQWAPAGDATTHGMIISEILYHNRFPSSYLPFANIPFDLFAYPRGFHVIGAVLCTISHIYPGQAALVIAGSTSILLPSLLSNLVYSSTKNRVATLVTFLFSYFVPLSPPLPDSPLSIFRLVSGQGHDLLMANFVNGTYPNHVSILLLLSALLLPIALSTNMKSFLTDSKRWLLLAILFGTATILVYYTFALFIGIFLLFWGVYFLLKSRSTHVNEPLNTEKRYWVKGMRWALLIVIVVIVGIALVLFPFIAELIKTYWDPAPYYLDPVTFFLTFDGVLITTCLALLLAFTINGHKRVATIAFLSLYIPLAMATVPSIFFLVLWMVPAIRARPALAGLTYCLFPIAILTFMSEIKRLYGVPPILDEDFSSSLIPSSRVLRKWFTIGLLGVILCFVAPPHIGFQPVPWEVPAGEDYQAIQFLLGVSTPEDLILNDRSWIGWSILSFRAQNVVFSRWLQHHIFSQGRYIDTPYYQRTLDCWAFFNEPNDTALASKVFTTYNVKYVFLGSSRKFIIWLPGGNYWWANENNTNPLILDTEWYFAQFDNYTEPGENNFLQLLFATTNTRVYEVLPSS